MANVVLIGGGGREHALAWKLAQSQKVRKIFVIPGNDGIQEEVDKAQCLNSSDLLSSLNNDKDGNSYDRLIGFCRQNDVTLVAIGPEAHLELGIVNSLEKAGIICFGPCANAARLETSKAFAKDFMTRNQIPTARYASFTDYKSAADHIRSCTYKALVVKASGLATGKGVVVAKSVEEACAAAKEALEDRKFGQAGSEIVVEELLLGQEISALAFTDGHIVKLMPFSQDHKHQLDNDQGPMTGGLGAYAPVLINDRDRQLIERDIALKTISYLKNDGITYKGVLYVGLMMTSSGPKVLEYNCRFGDPEAEVLIKLLKSDLYEIMLNCAQETLHACNIKWFDDQFVCGVVMASGGYPESYEKGFEITGLDDVTLYEKDVVVFHSGTKLLKNDNTVTERNEFSVDDDRTGQKISNSSGNKRYATNGGRVLCVTATGTDLLRAYRSAYCACARIKFHGCQYRHDIGAKALFSPVTYDSAGVSIDAANDLVKNIKKFCASTGRPGSDNVDIGGFGGSFDLKAAGYDDCILVSGTDGVGTKLKIAQEIGRHDTVGIDLVAMCVNDILVHNAEPLFFLDYYATGKLDVDVAQNVIKGIAVGCQEANCALIGGETAEMPGFYEHSEYDIAGFAVGGVKRLDACFPNLEKIKPDDLVLGLASSGCHSNGFSLVRKIVREIANLSYTDKCPWMSSAENIGICLLQPTRIYVQSVLPILREGLVNACAHITGGGLLENIPRILPNNFGVKLDAQKWTIPELFKWLANVGRVPAPEMVRTFNCGIGIVFIVPRENVESVKRKLTDNGETVFEIGHVTTISAGQRAVEIDNLTNVFPTLSIIPHTLREKIRVGVLISGSGTNFKALLDHTLIQLKRSCCRVAVVISNKEAASGINFAKAANIPAVIIPHAGKTREKFDEEVDAKLREYNVEFVCLAGFMRVLTSGFVKKWHGRMLNIHPSLLPSFKGADAVKQVLASGVRISGSTVHFVAAEIDSGAIVDQTTVRVHPTDNELMLHERIKRAEHKMYPTCMEMVASGRALLNNANRTVFVKGAGD